MWGLPRGLIADQRARPNRVLRMLVGSGKPAFAVFDRGFPGTCPFRAPDAAHALSLLRALRPFAPDDAVVFVALENQPDLTTALVAAGAELHTEMLFLRGPLPVV